MTGVVVATVSSMRPRSRPAYAKHVAYCSSAAANWAAWVCAACTGVHATADAVGIVVAFAINGGDVTGAAL
jgi:hypothetical protein